MSPRVPAVGQENRPDGDAETPLPTEDGGVRPQSLALREGPPCPCPCPCLSPAQMYEN